VQQVALRRVARDDEHAVTPGAGDAGGEGGEPAQVEQPGRPPLPVAGQTAPGEDLLHRATEAPRRRGRRDLFLGEIGGRQERQLGPGRGHGVAVEVLDALGMEGLEPVDELGQQGGPGGDAQPLPDRIVLHRERHPAAARGELQETGLAQGDRCEVLVEDQLDLDPPRDIPRLGRRLGGEQRRRVGVLPAERLTLHGAARVRPGQGQEHRHQGHAATGRAPTPRKSYSRTGIAHHRRHLAFRHHSSAGPVFPRELPLLGMESRESWFTTTLDRRPGLHGRGPGATPEIAGVPQGLSLTTASRWDTVIQLRWGVQAPTSWVEKPPRRWSNRLNPEGPRPSETLAFHRPRQQAAGERESREEGG